MTIKVLHGVAWLLVLNPLKLMKRRLKMNWTTVLLRKLFDTRSIANIPTKNMTYTFCLKCAKSQQLLSLDELKKCQQNLPTGILPSPHAFLS